MTQARLLGYRKMADKRRGRRCKELSLSTPMHPLVRQFFTLVNREPTLTFKFLSERSGVQIDTMSQWRYEHSPALVTFEAALNAAGYELCIRRRKNQ
jgi:hypothetical protein